MTNSLIAEATEYLASLTTLTGNRALDQSIESRGHPNRTRCDNGPEYISSLQATWAINKGSELMVIQSGNPQQNAHVERYNRTVRHGWLNHYLLDSIEEVQNRATQ